MEDLELEFEKEKLKETVHKFKETISYYEERAKAVPKLYKDNDIMIESLINMYDDKMRLIYKNMDKPYFARIDFKRDNEKNIEKIYIGKVGVTDEENNIVTVDWRAPISSIYYDSNIGRTKYIAPESICEGELLLKRQFNIENQKLISYQDVDTVANDELLKPYLSSSADNRLKNIVSTIQKEQNEIIREPLNKNIIVQGVAGSGKTTVALHRIAYLVYNYRDTVKPNQYLVIGPNKFFVSYISNVLPDLDVDNVNQLTYDELCKEYINEDFSLISEDEKIKQYIKNPNSLNFQNLKVSMEFKNALDKYIEEIDKNIIPNKNIEIKGYVVFSSEFIKNTYNSIRNHVIYDNIEKKVNRTKLLLQKYIEDNLDNIKESLQNQFKEKTKDVSNEIKYKEMDTLSSIEKELSKGFKQRLNKFLNPLLPNIYKTYITFLSRINEYIDLSNYNIKTEDVNYNIKNLKSKKVEFEDLSSLIYLKTCINGVGEYENYKQVAIDEAQDFGDFNFVALKKLLSNATFSIFGDLAQSIYQYRGIKNWESVQEIAFNNKCEIKNLHKSYRTTTEIMNCASNITKHLGLNVAEPVIRHGKNVEFINFSGVDEQIKTIENILEEYLKEDFKTIAIICKDEDEASTISKRINKKYKAVNITDSDTMYNGGICVITSYLAKGLEFDGAIVSNASKLKYDENNDMEMKLLYVAMTRPLHELKVLYDNELAKPLDNML